MLFVVPVVLFDMLKAKQLACVSESGQKCPAARSLSLRRAWIEIRIRWMPPPRYPRRSPYGERGLKFVPWPCVVAVGWSLSLRRAWIEMAGARHSADDGSRSPYGERGLKFRRFPNLNDCNSRSPYGERGLKFQPVGRRPGQRLSLSLRRAWIEIQNERTKNEYHSSRSPYGERGLKSSLSATRQKTRQVALLTESVD